MDIRSEISVAAGRQLVDIEPIGGGCVSEVYRVRLTDGKCLVAKFDEDATTSLPIEAFMLAYLAEHTQLPVPAVHSISNRLLLMDFVPGESHFSPDAERHAAELLAALHDLTSPTYGFTRDTLIGGLHQPNPPTTSWLDFFRDQRLLYMSGEAARVGRLPSSLQNRIEHLCVNLDRWLFEPVRPSMIHGDVWTTNILATGGRITAFLDPAIYFAHDEIELAFTTLFHTFGRAFYDRYEEIRPINAGFFEERRDLYNLYPLLVHVRLFGGSYVSTVERTVARFGF